MNKARWAFVAFLLIAACAGEELDLGSTTTGDASVGSSSSSVAGTWNGYIQSYAFPDGSDAMRITFTTEPDGTTSGTVFFGSGPALAPPTDANAGYPPSYWTPLYDGGRYQPCEGFAFTAEQVTVNSGHVKLGVSSVEVWKAWCELQTKIYPEEGGVYACCKSPTFTGDEEGPPACDPGQKPPDTDVGKLTVCRDEVSYEPGSSEGCTCTATACTVDLTRPDVHFDVQLENGQLIGSVTGLDPNDSFVVLNVYMTRSQ